MTRPFLFRLLAVLACLLAAPLAMPAQAQEAGCTVVLRPGSDVSAALAAATAGATVCLEEGEYSPLVADAGLRPGIALRGVTRAATIAAEGGDAIRIEGAERLTLRGLTVVGDLSAAGGSSLTLRDVHVIGDEIGVLIDGGRATLTDVLIQGGRTAGLVARGAQVSATSLRVQDTGGYGIAAVGDDASLSVGGSVIEGGAAAAAFAGSPGCAELPLGTADIPFCFYDDFGGAIAGARLELSQVEIGAGPGTGVLVFPGATARVERSMIAGRERGALLAWGATVTVSESLMLENATVGLESRAYPDGRGAPGLEGHTIVMRSLVRGTMTGGWPASGEGIVARGGTLEVRESTIDGNEGAAVLLSDGAVAAISGSRVINNGGPPFCFGEGTAAAEAENDVAGNGRLTPVCGD